MPSSLPNSATEPAAESDDPEEADGKGQRVKTSSLTDSGRTSFVEEGTGTAVMVAVCFE